MDQPPTTARAAASDAAGPDDRRRILELLSREPGATVLCFDDTITRCDVPDEVIELGLPPFELGDDEAAPVTALRQCDREAAFAAILRARSEGLADTVVHRHDDDGELVVHVVNMIDEWGVLVVVVGGAARPLLDMQPSVRDPQLPRRLVHRRDRHGHTLEVDAATERLLGWEPAEMLGVSAVRFVDPADHDRAIQGWIEMLSGGHPERGRVRYLTASGDRRWLEVALTNRLDDPDHGDVEVELIDVHDEMVALSAAKFGAAQFDALTESLPVGVIQIGADGEILYSNQWVRDVIGVEGRWITDWGGIVADAEREALVRASEAALEIGAPTNVDVSLVGASGATRRCRLRIRSLGADEDGRSRGAIASIEDMTDTLELQSRLHTQVRTDGLTGLPNRLALDEWLDQHLFDDPRCVGVTALYLDLDGFKYVNDSHGHTAGDRVLCSIASRLALALETSDILARIGGDEFVIARPAILDDDECATLARQVLDIFERGVAIDSATVELGLGCSIGITRADSARSAASILCEADLAMYVAKQAGGNRWVVHGESRAALTVADRAAKPVASTG